MIDDKKSLTDNRIKDLEDEVKKLKSINSEISKENYYYYNKLRRIEEILNKKND